MNEDLNNEEVVEKDVPETSEENLEEVNIGTSEDGEQIQESVEETETKTEDDIEAKIEARANELMEEKIQGRLARQERKFNKELSKYKKLGNVVQAGLGVDNIDDAISKTSNFYQEQGITIPEFKDSYSERDEKILAKADAKEIIDLGRDEMEAEANRIAGIPEDHRTIRERVMFDTICEELMNLKATDELKAKGYDTSILDDKSFRDFRNQFAVSTPILKIYDMYNQLNGHKVEQPKSPGSAKNSNTNNEIKDYYTPDEVRAFKEEELDNPKLMKAIERSMQLWGKSK